MLGQRELHSLRTQVWKKPDRTTRRRILRSEPITEQHGAGKTG